MPDPSPVSRKRVQTRNHIVQVAFGLFEQHGYEAVTMERIAAAAGVARATLYNHFPVKEAVLVHGLHEQLAHDIQSLMPVILAHPTFASRLAALLEPSARWWQAHRQYAAPYIRFRFQQIRDGWAGRQPSSDMIAVYVSLITEAREAGELRTDESAMRLAHYLHFLYLCALMTWLDDPEVSLDDEVGRALAFFIEGVARR